MSPQELNEKFRQWAILRQQTELVQSRMNRLRDDLMATVIADGDRDEKGSSTIRFPVSISVGAKDFIGIKREARTSETINKDRALALARAKNLQDEIIVHEPSVDIDALYAAWQRGQISEAELDALFDKKVTYAFKPVTS